MWPAKMRRRPGLWHFLRRCEANYECDDDGQCIPSDGIKWVRIAGGTFLMGSDDGALTKASSFSYGTTFKMTKTGDG